MRRVKNGAVRGLAAMLAVFALLFSAALFLLGKIDRGSSAEQTAMIRSAVSSALVTCYAVEGSYPSDVEYLRQNYGLAYDTERYLVTIDAFASNIMPDVRVLVRGEAGL